MTLRFVSKTDIWSLQDPTARQTLAPSANWRLKSIQDAVTIERLSGTEGLDIGEIGGGDSRVLPLLAAKNRCFNIDPFDGSGGGLKDVVAMDDVTTIRGTVGEPLDWPAASFDILFSISVIEHVPLAQTRAFFEDCARLLRPGGLMLHLIDFYLDDQGERNKHSAARIEHYRAAFDAWLEPTGTLIGPDGARFSCSFATNPDFIMQRWNAMKPALTETRSNAQSCALLMEGRKRG